MNNEFKLKNGSGRLCCGGCGRQNNKLNTYDWLADIPGNAEEQDMVEVQFKKYPQRDTIKTATVFIWKKETSWRWKQVRDTTSVRLR